MTAALLGAAPTPIREYPGIKMAFDDLVQALARGVREASGISVATWAAREMHAATPAEIVSLVDAASETLVEHIPAVERSEAMQRIDAIRCEIADYLRLQQSQTRDVTDEVIEGLLAVIRLVDDPLAEHLDGVGALAGRIAHEMGHDAEFIRTCVSVGRLHDIGKMALPRHILDKPGKLSAEEYEVIKRHSDVGYRMVMGIPGMQKYATGVRGHHERMNGSGYPDGLIGEEIPLEARICAVADVFHAMTSDRLYRAPMDPYEAITLIVQGRTVLYDDIVVDAALTVLGARQLKVVAA